MTIITEIGDLPARPTRTEARMVIRSLHVQASPAGGTILRNKPSGTVEGRQGVLTAVEVQATGTAVVAQHGVVLLRVQDQMADQEVATKKRARW